VIGTTRDAFFSLDRLADFLATAPLDLERALNLDGGPIACQSIRVGRYHHKFYALGSSKRRRHGLAAPLAVRQCDLRCR